jgi:HlyD family secretion protein
MLKRYISVALLACLPGLQSCSNKAASADAGGADEAAAAAPVQVTPAARQTIHEVVTAEAVLYPIKQASITPKVSAPVARFLVQRGDHVREGQLLAILEDRDLVAAAQESKQLYEQSEAAFETTKNATMPDDLTKARADAESAREALDASKRVYQNRLSLLQQGAVAQKLVDDAKVALVQAQALYDTSNQHLKSLESVGRPEQLKAAQAQRDAARAHYESAAAQVSYAEVRSPISGVISDRPINVGEMASAGSPLLSVVDISKVIARANVAIREAAAIRTGRPATITTAGGELPAKVTVVSPAVDPNTTTIQIWIEATNKGELLKPGTTAQISMDIGDVPNAVVVPASALLAADDGGERVMIAGKDSLAHESKVKVGVRTSDQAQILSGVNPGDQVITEGALGLDDKAKITITQPADEAGAGDKAGEESDKK